MGGLWHLLPGSGVKMKRELLPLLLLHKLKASLNPSVATAFNAILRLSVVTFWPPIQNPSIAVSLSCRAPSKPLSHNLFILSAAAVLHPHAVLIRPGLFILHDNGARNSIAVDLWCMFQGKRRQSKKTGGSVQEASLIFNIGVKSSKGRKTEEKSLKVARCSDCKVAWNQ